MIVAILSRRVGTLVVVMLFGLLVVMIIGLLVVMLFSLLLAVIFGAILRADSERDHGGEGERRQGEDKRFPRMLMHGQSSTDCFEEQAL